MSKNRNLSPVARLANVAIGLALATAWQTASAGTLPLRMVDKKEFCRRLGETFSEYGSKAGYDQIQIALLAGSAPNGLVKELRAGRATDYINATALRSMTQDAGKGMSGEIINVVSREQASGVEADHKYLPLGGFISHAMGLMRTATLAMTTEELRYLPHAQRGIDIVLITADAKALTPERTKMVAETAASLNIRISIVWVGPVHTERDVQARPELLNEAKTLAWLAATTGGTFANLGGQDEACVSQI